MPCDLPAKVVFMIAVKYVAADSTAHSAKWPNILQKEKIMAAL